MNGRSLIKILFIICFCLYNTPSYCQENIVSLEYAFSDSKTEFEIKVKGTPEDLENAIYAGSYLGEFRRTQVKTNDLPDAKIKKRLQEMDKIEKGLTKLNLQPVYIQKTTLSTNNSPLEENKRAARVSSQAADPFAKLKGSITSTHNLFKKGKFDTAYKRLRSHSAIIAKLRKSSLHSPNMAKSIRLYDEIIRTYFHDGLLKSQNNGSPIVYFNTPAKSLDGATIRQLANFCMLYVTCRDEPYLGWLILLDQYKPSLAPKVYSIFYKAIILSDKNAESRLKQQLTRLVKKLDIFKDFKKHYRACHAGDMACKEAYKHASTVLAKRARVLWEDYTFNLGELI